MTKKDDALAVRTANSITQYSATNPIGAILNAITDKEITEQSVAALEKLVGVYERMEDRRSEQLFAEAKAALQAELPQVAATRIIPSKDGTVRSTFASFEDIMAAVQPCLNKHGFSVSFDIDASDDGKRLQATCLLMHAGGHCKSNKFAVRIGNGPPGCSEAQADGAARSYARRGALCDSLNIVVDHDSDARSEGGTITQEQAEDLRARLKAVSGNEAGFLKFAGADSFEEIRTGRYGSVDAQLALKERTTKLKPEPTTTLDEGSNLTAEDCEALLTGGNKPRHRT